jgi:heme-degrading monooxygenase HmoA
MAVNGNGILEHVILPVRAGAEEEFEQVFEQARHIIAASPGCRGVTLSRGIENRNTYLLLVSWDSLEAHEVGFRQSPAYDEWRALLHHFYDPKPVVEHFVEVSRTGSAQPSS